MFGSKWSVSRVPSGAAMFASGRVRGLSPV